jgi:hypothetical protein
MTKAKPIQCTRELAAVAQGLATFEAGPVTVAGLARSSINGQATDAHQWLVNVMLFNEFQELTRLHRK